MSKASSSLLTGVAVCVLLMVEVGHAAPAPLAFAQAPLLSNARVSPDGRYFFARVSRGATSTFSVFDLEADGAVVASLQETDKGSVEWARWANNDTVLFRLGFLGGRSVTLRVEGQAERYYTQSYSDVFVMPVPSSPGQEAEATWQLTRRGSLVDVLNHDPDHVLVQEIRGGKFPEVYRRSIRTPGTKGERVQKRVFNVHHWAADRSGAVRIGYGGELTRSGRANHKLIVRAQGESDFRDISDHYYTHVDQRFVLYGFAEDTNQAYVGSNHETDTLALYLFDIHNERFGRQIYHNPDFDIGSVRVDERTGALLSVEYGGNDDSVVWFDESLNREVDSIAANFTGRDVRLASYTVDADAGLVAVSSPTFAGQLYLYDRKRKELSPLPLQHEDLPESEMGEVVVASYPARDGATIPAYLTLPPGVPTLSEARRLPFVIAPHGGPAARDFLRFDPVSQFFATRGYAVLQMNFRGSSGYGVSFEQAGRRQWGRLMQDDVSDGVAWLIDEGIADPDRIAIFGASYGGYAALMGAVVTPDLYRCAISLAGVTNLPDLVSGAHKSSYVANLIGDRFTDGDDLKTYSPLFRAADFAVPVLLVHGRLDGIVPYDHATALDLQLRKARKDVQFVTLPRSGHSLNDYDDRLRFYELLEGYLDGCLGAPVRTPSPAPSRPNRPAPAR